MKRLIAVLLLGGMFACTQARPCTADADCVAFQAICDPELKACIRSDGGMGGGGGTSCSAGCEAWQTCRTGGTCADLTVRVTAPQAGTVYGGGASVRLVATVTEWDGGAWSGTSIPAMTSAAVVGPSSLTRMSAGQYTGDFTLPNTSGTHTLTAGWPTVSSNVQVETQVCTASCADWQECVPNGGAGTCRDLFLTLEWQTPAEDAKYPLNANVPLSLVVNRADGGGFSKPVPFTLTGGAGGSLSLNAGSWIGNVTSGTSDGRRTLTAGWDGGPTSPARHFVVDGLAPRLALVVVSDGGAFQRDTILTAVLTSDEPIVDAGVLLGGVPMPRVADSSCPNFASLAGKACFQLDFSRPALNAISAGFFATLSGTDDYSNSGASDGGMLSVTRQRWSSCPAGCGAGTDITALALAPDGGVIVGFTKTAAVGGVMHLSAINGTTSSGFDGGAVQSLAVSDDVVFFAMNDATGGQIGGFGPSVTFQPARLAAANKTASGIALLTDATNGVGALGSINFAAGPSNGRACLYYPTNTATYFGTASIYDSIVVSSATTPTAAVNVTISGASTSAPLASFLSKPAATGASWQPVANLLATPNAGTPAPVLTLLMGIPPMGQALLPDGGFLLATQATGTNDIFVGQWDGSGSPTVAAGNLGEDKTTGVPVVANANEAYAGRGGGLYRFDPASLAATTAVLDDGGTDNYYLSPVLTKGQDAGVGLGYAVSANGNLVAFSLGSGGGVAWQAEATGAQLVLTHPTLDCNRQSPQTKTGLLYIGTQNGRVHAFVVDSPGLLNTPGAWPKYQRSAGNAGNDDLVNFPTNWPGCP